MTRDISNLAGLSQVYTNHCVRATTCTVLDQAGATTRQIMAITGHRNESSVRSYTHKLNNNQKQFLSDTLSNSRTSTEFSIVGKNFKRLSKVTPTPNSTNSNTNVNNCEQLIHTSANDRSAGETNVRLNNVRPTVTYKNNLEVDIEDNIEKSSIFTGCQFYGNVTIKMKK